MSTIAKQNLTTKDGNGDKRTLYSTVTDALRQQLGNGYLSAGTRMPSLRKLADQYNVSTMTIRQALRALEEEGRLYCIHGVGTFVRPTIPQRRSTKQITLAFSSIEIEEAFTSRIARAIEEACRQRGWSMQIYNAQCNPHIEADNLSRIGKSGISGVIILPVCEPNNFEAIFQLKLSGFPIVSVDRFIPGLKVDVVESDHANAAHKATSYLLDKGHKQILMVTNEPSRLSSVRGRIEGYERALIDRGLEPHRDWKIYTNDEVTDQGVRDGKRWFGGYKATFPVLKNIDTPIAILANDAYCGWGAIEACRELGLSIPQDVSIICFDDSEFMRALSPPVTSLVQHTDKIGHMAVELLERRMSVGNKAEPKHVLYDVELIERGSVASPIGSTR